MKEILSYALLFLVERKNSNILKVLEAYPWFPLVAILYFYITNCKNNKCGHLK